MLLSARCFILLGAVTTVTVLGFVVTGWSWIAVGLDLVILIAAFVDFRLCRRLRPGVNRFLPATLHQGEKASVCIELTNPTRRPLRVRLRDLLCTELTRDPFNSVQMLAPRSRTEWKFEIVPRRRGKAELAPVAIRVLGPLGLTWREFSCALDQVVRVLPRAHFEGKTGLVLRTALERRLGANPLQSRGLSNELYALREYQSGDDYRHIHWKQTARLNRPFVREHTWEQHQQIVIMVDCGRTMASLAHGYSKLDHALASILALMRVIVAQQDAATLVLFSKEILKVVRVDRRTRSFASVFDRVYQQSADLEEPNYADVAAWCARKIPRRSLVILATSVIDLLSADILGRALFGLAARHRPLLVNLEDPELLSCYESIPSDVVGGYAKASAMSIVESNRSLGTRLRAQGVEVLTTPASLLTISVIQGYLDFKTRGRV